MSARIRLILSLVRRDYAIQYAGTALGLVWLLVRYSFQIGIFLFVFGLLFGDSMRVAPGSDYLSFLLGGMTLWLPLSEMILRSAGILVDNRALIRRTSVGADAFLWIPVVQSLFQYIILSLLAGAGLLVRGSLSPMFPLALLFGLAVILVFSGWGFFLARVSVLLKDTTPLLGILLQVVFWSTPIAYAAPASWARFFLWHPLAGMMAVHRALFSGGPMEFDVLLGGGVFLLVSLPVYFISSRRLRTIVGDQL